MIFIVDVTSARFDSTASFIENLSTLVSGGISYPVEQLALRYLVDRWDCPLCLATAGFMCWTYGSQNLRRTHLERLQQVNDAQRRLAVDWALREYERQRREDDW